MTDRDKIREQLSAWLDGELGDADVRRLEKAVELAAELAIELEQLRATRELVRRLPRKRAPEDFVDRVLARAERLHLVGGSENEIEPPSPLRWVRMAATAAILLIAVGTGIVITYSLLERKYGDDIASKSDQTAEPASVELHGRGEAEKLGKGAVDIDGVVLSEFDGYFFDYCEKLREGLDLESELTNYYSSNIKSIEIYTDNLDLAQKDVVKVLELNGIQTVRQAVASNRDRANNTKDDVDPLENSFQVKSLNEEQVQIVVLVDEDQLEKLDKDLKTVISNQLVSQRSSTGSGIIAGRALGKTRGVVVDGAEDKPAKSAKLLRDSAVGKAGGRESEDRRSKATPKPTRVHEEVAGAKDEGASVDEESPESEPRTSKEDIAKSPPKAVLAAKAGDIIKTDDVQSHADSDEKTEDETTGTGEVGEKFSKDGRKNKKSSALSKLKTAPGEVEEKTAEADKASVPADDKSRVKTPGLPGCTTAPSTPKSGLANKAERREKAPTTRKELTSRAKQGGPTTAATTRGGQSISNMQRRSQRLRPVLITLNNRAITVVEQKAAGVKPPASQPETAPACNEAPVAPTTKPAESEDPPAESEQESKAESSDN